MLRRAESRTVWLALAFACASTACIVRVRETHHDRDAAPPAIAPAAPATPCGTPPASPTSSDHPAAAPAPATAPNRDVHGNPDVAKYVSILQSPERVADLQVDVVVERLALQRDAVIGDLGCGPGLFALAFAQACPDGLVYACDIEPAQLDQVRERIHEQHVANVIPVLASSDDPHLPLRRLDLLFIGDTYHHLDDRVAYMRRAQSLLKPGGRLALLEYKPGTLPVGPPADHKLPAGVMERELAEAGWVRAERFETHAWHEFEIWRVGDPQPAAR